MRDPYNNVQIRFDRTDKTGRWSPIVDDDEESAWVLVIGSILASAVFALIIFLGV